MKSTWIRKAAVGTFRLVRRSFGWALALTAFCGTAWGFDPAPEIDPGSALSSLALLAGGVLLLKERYWRR